MDDDRFQKLARQLQAVERKHGMTLGRHPSGIDEGHSASASPSRGLMAPMVDGGEVAEPSPEDRAEETRDAIRWHAEQLRELGDGKVADAVLKAVGPKRPRGAPRTVSDDEAMRVAADNVMQVALRNPHLSLSAVCRLFCPVGVKEGTFRKRVDRLIDHYAKQMPPTNSDPGHN